MTISRGQMNRELYGLGSLVKKITGGAKKAVKKVAGGIGDILSSDIGKAALLAYGAYKFGPMIGDKLGAMSMPKFLTGNVAKNLAIGAAGAMFGGAFAGKSEEEIAAITRDQDTLKSYLRQYYTNLNPELRNQPDKVEEFVNAQVVEYNQGRLDSQAQKMVLEGEKQWIILDLEELHEYIRRENKSKVYINDLISDLEWTIFLAKN